MKRVSLKNFSLSFLSIWMALWLFDHCKCYIIFIKNHNIIVS